MAEEAITPESVVLDFEIIHKNDEDQIAYGVVMEPDVFDAHNHVADRAEIEKAMHSFMEKKWKPIGLQHKEIGYGIKIVENAIARSDFEMGDETVSEGSWFMGVHIPDPDTWQDVKDGKYTGFSIGAEARLEDVE